MVLLFLPHKNTTYSQNRFLMTKSFKIVALLEGISLLLLLFFAVPMKHVFGMPVFVRTIGMAHGLLFISYIIMASMLKSEEKWDTRKFITVCLASVIPFGTFYSEKKYFRNN
jgi:integral membrane protein